MESGLIFHGNWTTFNHRTKRNCWHTKVVLQDAVDMKFSRAIRGLERLADSMESANHFSSRPDRRSIADVPSFTLRTARSAKPFVSDR